MNLPPLYLITDAQRVGQRRLLDVVEASVRGGLSMLQIREKKLPDRELAQLVEGLRERLVGDVRLILNRQSDFDTVVDWQLDGVHLGGDPRWVSEARKSLSDQQLVGFSAHSVEEAKQAFQRGGDYVSFSPIYPPTSKESFLPPVGLVALRTLCESVRRPVFALGGIDASRVSDVRRAGACGVAVIGAIVDAPNPEAATRSLLQAWEGTKLFDSNQE